MKNIIKKLTLFLMLITSTWIIPQKATAQGGTVSFQVFYDELSPYGTWVESPEYGYVWVPNAGPGFTPYATNGYWTLTDYGWTWVSSYPWGWAPFHYGRWYTDDTYGPMWVPDNQWGPGWVSWRRSSGYYGWAPIGPGISNSMAYSNDYHVPHNHWTFVRDRRFGRHDIHRYYIRSASNEYIYNHSNAINNSRTYERDNATYNAGPDRREVERYGGRKFTPVAVQESSKPGQEMRNNRLEIYRPQVQKEVASGTRPTPTRVANLKDVKPPAERKAVKTANNASQPMPQKTLPPKPKESLDRQKPLQPGEDKDPAQQKQAKPKQDLKPERQKPVPPNPEDNPAQQKPTQPKPDMKPGREKPFNQKDDLNPDQNKPVPLKQNMKPDKQKEQIDRKQPARPKEDLNPAGEKQFQPDRNKKTEQEKQTELMAKPQPAQSKEDLNPAPQKPAQPRPNMKQGKPKRNKEIDKHN